MKKAVELLESGEAFPKAPVSVEPQKEEKKDGKKKTTAQVDSTGEEEILRLYA